MRAIIGKIGKSRILAEEMKNYNKDEILLVDMVGVGYISDLASWQVNPKNFTELIALFEGIENIVEFKKVKYIVLEINAKMEEADVFLNWEERLNKKLILTIQDNEMDRIFKVDMSLPRQ